MQITVSTVGLVPEIRRFATECEAQLAVSLHATTDEVRNWIAPINRKYNLATLIGTLEELYPMDASLPNHGRFVFIEYAPSTTSTSLLAGRTLISSMILHTLVVETKEPSD